MLQVFKYFHVDLGIGFVPVESPEQLVQLKQDLQSLRVDSKKQPLIGVGHKDARRRSLTKKQSHCMQGAFLPQHS